jgi:hypothetical protein
MKRILAIPDLHCPANVDLKPLYTICKKLNPQIIIQLGDSFDCLSASRFPHSKNLFTPREEYYQSKETIEFMWKELHSICPRAERHMLFGNHGARVPKRILESCPELEHLIDIESLFSIDGVNCYFDKKYELEIEGILFIHGSSLPLGGHAKFYNKSVCRAHSHRGEVTFFRTFDHPLWEMACGFLGDVTKSQLQYTQTKTVGWTLGVGYIDDLGPRFIPL